jgi:Zn-dependent protease
MISSLLRGGITKDEFILVLITFPVVLISLVIHELAHGWMAKKLGDPTAEWHGRLSLNPLKHLDPLGTVTMLLFGIGWAKPVPINPRYFRNPKKGMALVGLAGPVSNLIIAFIAALLRRVTVAIYLYLLPASAITVTSFKILMVILNVFYVFEVLNISLAVFNLIPVPPFDGSRVFYFLLPDKYYFGVMRYERQIMFITFAVLFSGALEVPLDFVRDGVSSLFHFIIGLVPYL